jgi:hypothetical protein
MIGYTCGESWKILLKKMDVTFIIIVVAMWWSKIIQFIVVMTHYVLSIWVDF